MRDASLITRFLALAIDSFIVGFLSFIVGLIFGDEILGIGIGFVTGLVYNTYFWTQNNGQTPAKSVFGIRVVSSNGRPINVLQAVIRYIGYYINTFLLLLGWLWAIVDPDNQGLHDKIASTRVVEA